ncbi:unnamed protein product [Psylliodes chrysocephalus]|uniref:Uncharacterized protein n=1 Tax=Psylliodes chrysocephalus TaxID=3402493 RepID=A0A9P0CT64_9CUCU|nr:unnamed protein product [Psylliodes chrysocephala]
MLVDVVRQESGTTNDGNVARHFFSEPALLANITGIDETLIRRFSVILQGISCGYDLNPEAFKKYALDSARLFVNLYPWFKMPSSVHKILIHGADVINSLILPIGQLSEEALEARHKECRYYRQYNS